MTTTLQTRIMKEENIRDSWFYAEKMIQGRKDKCTIIWPREFPPFLAVAFYNLHGHSWRKSDYKNRLEIEWQAR